MEIGKIPEKLTLPPRTERVSQVAVKYLDVRDPGNGRGGAGPAVAFAEPGSGPSGLRDGGDHDETGGIPRISE
jgi:hypothetical protein